LGANPQSGFVRFVYNLTQVFLIPFRGIFRSLTSPGIETMAVFEPGTLMAMLVYALLAYAVVKIIGIRRARIT